MDAAGDFYRAIPAKKSFPAPFEKLLQFWAEVVAAFFRRIAFY